MSGMKTVLLVEDNEMNRDMLSRRLEKRGYAVTTATDGEQACELAFSVHPDIILMDLSLPVMDGWEATRRIKSNPMLSYIPVIALTAHAVTGDRERSLAAGCDDYETKPINFPSLLEKIAKHLGTT